jgi:hypothetical protein
VRINVYAEELTDEVEVVKKTIEDGREFLAVRLYLRSAKELHNTPNDDDRTAITFWVPYYNGCNHPGDLSKVLWKLYDASGSLISKPEAPCNPAG